MSQARVNLDFLEKGTRISPAAVVIMCIGVLAVASAVHTWRDAEAKAESLQLRLDDRARSGLRSDRSEREDPVARRSAVDVARALAIPWNRMLSDLESVGAESRSDVAVLGVEPDREHGRVVITAEARSLVAALQYLQRLQDRPAVRNALLQSHAVEDKKADRPVRVQILAEWRRAI